MVEVHVSSKGQVVIPVAVRHRLGIKPGSRLELSEDAGELRLKPVRSDRKIATIDQGVGLAGYKGPPVGIEAMTRAVQQAAARQPRSAAPAARPVPPARGREPRGG